MKRRGHGDLCLFSNGTGLMYRCVEWHGPDTLALHSEKNNYTMVLQYPEDEGAWEIVARVDRVLKPVYHHPGREWGEYPCVMQRPIEIRREVRPEVVGLSRLRV